MKCLILFSMKNKKKYFNISSSTKMQVLRAGVDNSDLGQPEHLSSLVREYAAGLQNHWILKNTIIDVQISAKECAQYWLIA